MANCFKYICAKLNATIKCDIVPRCCCYSSIIAAQHRHQYSHIWMPFVWLLLEKRVYVNSNHISGLSRQKNKKNKQNKEEKRRKAAWHANYLCNTERLTRIWIMTNYRYYICYIRMYRGVYVVYECLYFVCDVSWTMKKKEQTCGERNWQRTDFTDFTLFFWFLIAIRAKLLVFRVFSVRLLWRMMGSGIFCECRRMLWQGFFRGFSCLNWINMQLRLRG